MLGFKDFDSAHVIPSGIEVMHMIKKGQMNCCAKAHCLPHSSSTRTFHMSSLLYRICSSLPSYCDTTVLARTFYPKKSHLYFAVNRNLLFYKEKHR
jgi:hypothetical protein